MSERKTALITGASRGIGRAIALELAECGYNIVVNYAGSVDAANTVVDLCKEKGVDAISVQANVGDANSVEQMFNLAKETFGGVDVLVNNAGITKDGLLISMKEEDFDAVYETNLKGTFLCTKLAAKMMIRKRSGRIINLSSVVGVHGNAGQSNYSATKAAVIGFTKSVAKEIAGRGVTVNAIAPGFIGTDMTDALPEAAKEALVKEIPMARIGDVTEIAKTVAFLASDGAGYITGQVLGVDGGMGM